MNNQFKCNHFIVKSLRIMRNQELTAKELHKGVNSDYEDKKTLTSIYRYLKKLKEITYFLLADKKRSEAT